MPPVAESSLQVKADFPIFKRRFGGRELIYLDSAATSQKPEVVIEALAEHLRKHNANIHRGVYPLAQEADAAYDRARRRVAEFTGAEPETTIFTKNVTEAINLVAYAWGRANVKRGDAGTHREKRRMHRVRQQQEMQALRLFKLRSQRQSSERPIARCFGRRQAVLLSYPL